MKRTLTYALSAVLGGMVVTPSLAQDNFPDAPENHWAYEALLNMKRAGLLVGYPDGLFRGGRPASRYELAVAIHATYQHLKNLADGMAEQIKALEARIPGGTDTSGFATKAELQAVRDSLNALQATVNGMKAWGDDIANLKRMASTFERELASLGVDVEAMKKGLNDLANRVAALEKRKLPVDIHGSMNLLALGGYSEDRRYGISREGRPYGVHRSTGAPTGIGHDINVWHEGTLTLSTTNEEGPKGRATMKMGNTLTESTELFGGGFGSRHGFHPSDLLTGVPFGDSDETDIWFQEFEISFTTSVWGQTMGARAGRIGKKVGPYTFQRPNTQLDYKDEYWDNGLWYFDGLDTSWNFGNVAVDIFGGRQSSRDSSDGTELWGMWAGNFGHSFEPGGFSGNNSSRPRGFTGTNGIMVDTHLGFVANIPIMDRGNLSLNYLMLDSDSTTTLSSSPLLMANRVTVFGGEVKFPIGGRLTLNAGYSQTNMNHDSSTVVDEDNHAWWARLAYNRGDRCGFFLGYRDIAHNFYAPGDWGRIGIWWNPTDVKGFQAGGHFSLSDRTKIWGNVEMLEGRDETVGGSIGLSDRDDIRSYRLNMSHRISNSWTLMLGGEWVEWDLDDRSNFTGGKPRERWYDVGFKYAFGENSWWSLKWELSDYDSKGVAGFNPFAAFPGDERATGGKITSQLSIRY
jgi:hypothetical protein